MKLEIRLTPGARHDRITAQENGQVKVRVTSPPVEGRANGHMLKLLARSLRVPKSSLKILRGQTSRTKLVEIGEFDRDDALRRLRHA